MFIQASTLGHDLLDPRIIDVGPCYLCGKVAISRMHNECADRERAYHEWVSEQIALERPVQ